MRLAPFNAHNIILGYDPRALEWRQLRSILASPVALVNQTFDKENHFVYFLKRLETINKTWNKIRELSIARYYRP